MDVYKAGRFIRKVRPFLHLRISLKILHYTGLWPAQQFNFLYIMYSFCFFVFTLGTFLCVEIVYVIINYSDIDKIISAVPLIITNLVHAYKFIVVLRYHPRIRKLLLIVESPIFSKHNSRYERILSWYAWQGIFHQAVYQILGAIAIIFWACIPINTLVKEHLKKLPVDGWYPYDTEKQFAFIFTWIHQAVILSGLCCINNQAIDAFISGLINVASCQFEILKWNLAELGNDIELSKFSFNSKEKDDFNFRDKKITEKIRDCVEHNLTIFDFIQEIQSIFSTAISLQLILDSLVICFSTYYISQLTEIIPAEIIGNVGYTLCISYEIFIYCWNGNELYLQNENLETAIYTGNWWKLNSSHKRDLYIIMLRSRKPLILATDFLIKLIIPTFMSIIRMSYSMFALLHRRNNT